MNPAKCLDEQALWNVLEGTAARRVSEHLDTCLRCQQRLQGLKISRDDVLENLSTVDFDEMLVDGESTGPSAQRGFDFSAHQATISRYRIIRCLSYGGQGQVFLADDVHLNRKVVIKVAHASITEDIVSSELIVAEGELLARMNHPQLAQVFDAGIEHGRPYLVMEYVEGRTLFDYVKECKLTENDIRRLILETASAVAAIHRNEIIHLDLKPENVIVSHDGHCKVVDLGTSWLLSDSEHCRGNIICGTISSMAPEQLYARHHNIGCWTDVFGLGAILYFLLTQRDLKAAQTPADSRAGLWTYAPDVLEDADCSESLKKICLQAIEPDFRCRIQSVSEFSECFAKPARRRQAAYFLGTGVLSLVIGLFQVLQFTPRVDVTSEVGNPTANVKQELLLSDGASEPRFLQIHVVNFPEEPTHFCLWTQTNELFFLPSIRAIRPDGVEVLKMRVAHQGLAIPERLKSCAIILIGAEYAGAAGTATINIPLRKRLDQQCQLELSQNSDWALWYQPGRPALCHVEMTKSRTVGDVIKYEFDTHDDRVICPEISEHLELF